MHAGAMGPDALLLVPAFSSWRAWVREESLVSVKDSVRQGAMKECRQLLEAVPDSISWPMLGAELLLAVDLPPAEQVGLAVASDGASFWPALVLAVPRALWCHYPLRGGALYTPGGLAAEWALPRQPIMSRW
jgi:hypothetical protein